MKQKFIKILSIITIIIMVVALVLLTSNTINPLYFWIIIGICAVIAFFGIPRLRKKKS